MDPLTRERESIRSILRSEAALLYRHTGAWEKGGLLSLPVRFSVRTLGPNSRDLIPAEQAAERAGVVGADPVIIRVHLDDALPEPGSTIQYDQRTLTVTGWSTESDFTGTRRLFGVLQ